MCSADPLFSFSTLATKPILHFCGTRGKMNTGKKHFDLARRNDAAGTWEVSKGGIHLVKDANNQDPRLRYFQI